MGVGYLNASSLIVYRPATAQECLISYVRLLQLIYLPSTVADDAIIADDAVKANSALLNLYRVLCGIFPRGLSSSKYWLYRPRRFRSSKAMSFPTAGSIYWNHVNFNAGANH